MKYEIGLAIVLAFGWLGRRIDKLVAKYGEFERIPTIDMREVHQHASQDAEGCPPQAAAGP